MINSSLKYFIVVIVLMYLMSLLHVDANREIITQKNVVSRHDIQKLLNVTSTEEAIAVVISDRLIGGIKYLKYIYNALNIKYKIFKLSNVLVMFPRGNEYESLREFARYVRYVLNYRYLLLIGDDISLAYFHMSDSLSVVEGVLKSTDMYYSLLDGSWDYDGDGKLLESVINKHSCIVGESLPDLIPDLIVGRLPFSNVKDIKKYYMDTVINFLWGTHHDINVLLAASLITLPGEEGNKYVIDGASALVSIERKYLCTINADVTRMFESEGLVKSIYNFDFPLNHKLINKALSKGKYDLILIISHGNGLKLAKKVWIRDDGDGRAEEDEIAYKVFLWYDRVPQIHSASIIYIDSCLANAIDLLDDNAIGVVLLRKGALAVIAPTRITYYKIDYLSANFNDELLELFVKYLVRTYPILDPAEAFYKSRAEYMIKYLIKYQACSHVKNALVYVFLGDPILIKYLFILENTYGNLHEYIIHNHNLLTYSILRNYNSISSLLMMKSLVK